MQKFRSKQNFDKISIQILKQSMGSMGYWDMHRSTVQYNVASSSHAQHR